MTWVLFVIVMTAESWGVSIDSKHTDMMSCFERRDVIVQQLGTPIINYQAVCAVTDQIGEKV
jgi:hypothetical protein